MKISSLNIKNIISSIKFIVVIPVALIARKFHNNVWIVTERPEQARDNGYCLYQYLREKQQDQDVYYIIDKKAVDYKKIKDYGNIIQFDSWKHFFYYCLSKVHISAHVSGCCPSDSPICRRIKRVLGIKDVFIPHGVSYGVSEFCLKKYAKIDLFICSGEPEYRNVLGNYGYSEEEVVCTGFPRLDMWHDIEVNPKQIVLMPTWRLYLAQDKNTVFQNTAYFMAYQSLIQNKELSIFLQKNDLKLIFYLHNNMRKYVDFFETSCSNIEVVYRDDMYDIQELLKSSALLITDYSSVHFDFAYMNKPVIYYQFDKKEFFERQYQKSSFDAEKDGFGPVAYDNEQLLKELICSHERSFRMEENYYKRMRKFYKHYDTYNCERVYQQIKRLEEYD